MWFPSLGQGDPWRRVHTPRYDICPVVFLHCHSIFVFLLVVLDGSPVCFIKAPKSCCKHFLPENPFFFFSAHALEAHINKMLLYSCHFCPTTNLTVAECPVAADAINVFSALSIDFKAAALSCRVLLQKVHKPD